MGKKNLTIGEISEILNITPSTLRFWEKENLFHVSKKSNHYRTYTNTDLIDIADILYYRNLGVPVKDIRAFSSLELSEYDQFLENQERELNKKIEEYQQMLLRSQSLKRNYYRLLRLLVLAGDSDKEVRAFHTGLLLDIEAGAVSNDSQGIKLVGKMFHFLRIHIDHNEIVALGA